MSVLKKSILATITAVIVVLIIYDGQAFPQTDKPLWNKSLSMSGFTIYKILIVCGREYGSLCRRFEDSMGNVSAPKTINLDNTHAKQVEGKSFNGLSSVSHERFIPASAVESDIPKNKIMAERYFQFILNRSKVREYHNRLKLN